MVETQKSLPFPYLGGMCEKITQQELKMHISTGNRGGGCAFSLDCTKCTFFRQNENHQFFSVLKLNRNLILVSPVFHVFHVISTSSNKHTVGKKDKSQGDGQAAG